MDCVKFGIDVRRDNGTDGKKRSRKRRDKNF